jgi:pimeloyl-ACP methyl ester carboxylesterase
MHRPTTRPHLRRRTFATIAALALAATAFVGGTGASADTARPPAAPLPTVVLVHGAWADGSSWSEVATRLQDAGYPVRVPPNNLRGVTSDAPDIANYLSTITGPIVLVGHSYGGFVITNAATGNDQVRALVYVDAVIPAEGDTLSSLTHPPSIFAQDPANFLDFVPYHGAPPSDVDTYVKPSIYREAMAADGLTPRQMDTLAASQRPLTTNAFVEPSGPPAWATIPSWAVVGEDDRIVPVGDQVAMARRAGSRVVELDAPHLSMLTDDRAVTDVIIRAAGAR